MANAVLPKYLSPRFAPHLVRLGPDRDGGYVVSLDDLQASDGLISFGVSDNWGFEEDFLEQKQMPLVAYDASVGMRVFFVRFLRAFFKIHKPWQVITRLKILIAYVTFFTAERQHIRKFVGPENGGKFVSLQSTFDNAPASKIFLKMDIEGAEYRILNILLANQDRLTGCVIEFHDCDLHLERIKIFISAFALPLVHIHANNVGHISPDGIPLVLEMTFSSHTRGSHFLNAPDETHDRANDPRRENIHLLFADDLR